MNIKRMKRILLSVALLFIIATGTAIGARAATPTPISVTPTKLTMVEGKTFSLSGGPGLITWSSSNPKVATVDQNGLVRAIKKGKATITARLNKETATCKVKVVDQNSAIYSNLLSTEYRSKDYYYVYDLDKKAPAELIVLSQIGSTGDYLTEVYSIRGERAVSLGEFSLLGQSVPPALRFSPKYLGLITSGYSASTDKVWKSMYCVKNGKLKLTRSLASYTEPETLLDIFTIKPKGERVTEEKLEAYDEKYFSETRSLTPMANTKANRKATFGI